MLQAAPLFLWQGYQPGNNCSSAGWSSVYCECERQRNKSQ